MKASRTGSHPLRALLAGVFLVGAPLAARAAQPTTASEASERAQHYSDLARSYRFQGGALYKTGTIQRAEADASNCAAVADAMRANTVVMLSGPSSSDSSDASEGDERPTVAVVVPSNAPAPATPKCPAP